MEEGEVIVNCVVTVDNEAQYQLLTICSDTKTGIIGVLEQILSEVKHSHDG